MGTKAYRDRIFHLKNRAKKLLPESALNAYYSLYPLVGRIAYGNPSGSLKVIGVTGTDGKSSTVLCAARMLEEAGCKTGFFSSIAFSDGAGEKSNTMKMTMPGKLFMQQFLRQLKKNGCEYAVLEVTSEGVKQKRHLFIDFDVAVVTNIKPEHIESHGGFDRYKKAKSEIFKGIIRGKRKGVPKTIVVNTDDPEARSFLSFKAERKITYGKEPHKGGIQGEIVESTLYKNIIRINEGASSWEVLLPIGGPFAPENALAAIAIGRSLGIPMEICIRALEKIAGIPGRFEIVSRKPFVIVDYGHTVAALEKLLPFVRRKWHGKIIHVFGAAGGGRDSWKRPRFGELSEQFCDISIITEENPFDEPRGAIAHDIIRGFKKTDNVEVILHRTDAVKKALELATEETLILCTGKGSETVIAAPLGKKIPYNEKETVLWLLGAASQE